MRRRDFCRALAAGWAFYASPGSAAPTPHRLAAAWKDTQGYALGTLEMTDKLRIVTRLPLPTRAHGLLRETSGTLLAVARRPGNWLLRWGTDGQPLTWRWSEPGRIFTGHLLTSTDGSTVYTGETNLETGAGLIGVRNAASLEKIAELPSGNRDPHQFVWDRAHPGMLLVANGGIETHPETGRKKLSLASMDSCLTRIHARTGEIVGTWRVADPRLSLRHLAWNGTRLGISMQAEHDDPAQRQAAPVLAVFEHDRLTVVPNARPVSGYGGDISAWGRGFAVGCPKADGVALFDGDEASAAWHDFHPWPKACALAPEQDQLLIAGHNGALVASHATHTQKWETAPHEEGAVQIDNHWLLL